MVTAVIVVDHKYNTVQGFAQITWEKVAVVSGSNLVTFSRIEQLLGVTDT
jgi:hypothetical protein